MGYVDKAVQALLGSDLLVNMAILDGSKIADITHADANEHTLTPAALGLPDNTIAIFIDIDRIAGTGTFRILTETGGQELTALDGEHTWWPIDDTGVFRYRLSVPNDDYDIFGFMIVVQGRLLG